jgi:hypothetical protein
MNNEFDNKPQDGEEIEESIAAKRLAHFSPEIKEGDGSELVIAREPGFLGWVKHTWFHHKFAIIVSVFLVVVSIICLRQCATRNSYDVDILYAGPWFSCDDGKVIGGMHEAFAFMIDDYDGDGKKNVAYTPLFLLSQEQLEALRAENEGKPDEEKIYISAKLLKDNRDMLDADIMTGEMSLCLLDPTIYWYMRENDLVDELSHYIDESLIPAGTNLEGYGIMLKDTAFGQYFSTFEGIPADTILCVRRAGVMNQAWNGEGQAEMRARYADLLTQLLSFELPQAR